MVQKASQCNSALIPCILLMMPSAFSMKRGMSDSPFPPSFTGTPLSHSTLVRKLAESSKRTSALLEARRLRGSLAVWTWVCQFLLLDISFLTYKLNRWDSDSSVELTQSDFTHMEHFEDKKNTSKTHKLKEYGFGGGWEITNLTVKMNECMMTWDDLGWYADKHLKF